MCLHQCCLFPQWEPVQFFNNKIICDLVEEKHRGIISILVCFYWSRTMLEYNTPKLTYNHVLMIILQDEECLRPGDATDLTFLERLEEKMGNHPHFVT